MRSPNRSWSSRAEVNATQLVLGASRRGRFAQAISRGVGVTTTAQSGKIDVHLVSHERVATVKRPRGARGFIGGTRRRLGIALALLGIPALCMVLLPLHEELSLTTMILIVLTAVMGLTLTGGMWPALLGALSGSILLNYFFTKPYNTLKVHDQEQLIALAIFIALALGGASVVNLSAARARLAARASAEAQTLTTLAGNVLRGGNRVEDLLEQLRETFSLESVTLLERTEPGAGSGRAAGPAAVAGRGERGRELREPGCGGERPADHRRSRPGTARPHAGGRGSAHRAGVRDARGGGPRTRTP